TQSPGQARHGAHRSLYHQAGGRSFATAGAPLVVAMRAEQVFRGVVRPRDVRRRGVRGTAPSSSPSSPSRTTATAPPRLAPWPGSPPGGSYPAASTGRGAPARPAAPLRSPVTAPHARPDGSSHARPATTTRIDVPRPGCFDGLGGGGGQAAPAGSRRKG